MRKNFILFLSLILLTFNIFCPKKNRLDCLIPICISDSTHLQYGLPKLIVKNHSQLLFCYLESIQDSYNSSSIKNINVYTRELNNGILANPINLTASIYNSNHPLIKTDNNGIIHLIWGESFAEPSMLTFIKATDIRYSYYNNGLWSNPKSIFQKDTLGNSNAFTLGKLEKDSRGRLHLLWLANDPKLGPQFYHKIGENCNWGSINKIPFLCADFDFKFDKNDRLHIVYLRPETSGGYDENSVFYRYSNDYGVTWSDSVLVNKSGNQNAVAVRMLIDHKNNIHLIWTKNISGMKGAAETIYYSFSADGNNWSLANPIIHIQQDATLYFSVTLDINNNIHLVYDLWKGFAQLPVNLYYSFWNGYDWSTPEVILNDAQMPEIQLDDSNFLHIVYATGNKGYKYYTRTTNPLITTVNEKKNNLPDKYELFQNYPNPFNPTTTITFTIPRVESRHTSTLQHVTLKIYDIFGREVATLVDGYKDAGEYKTQFSINNSQLSSGIYFYKIKVGDFIETKKMILLK